MASKTAAKKRRIIQRSVHRGKKIDENSSSISSLLKGCLLLALVVPLAVLYNFFIRDNNALSLTMKEQNNNISKNTLGKKVTANSGKFIFFTF